MSTQLRPIRVGFTLQGEASYPCAYTQYLWASGSMESVATDAHNWICEGIRSRGEARLLISHLSEYVRALGYMERLVSHLACSCHIRTVCFALIATAI
jgi:hypothetical protein